MEPSSLDQMRKLALLVEYEGTRYCGFQIQPDQPTVQTELTGAIGRLTGQEVRVQGASRTDSGVHAWGQVVCFKTSSRLRLDTFVSGLNRYLPSDIAVKGVADVDESFDPRRSARERYYRYTILNAPTRTPRWRQWAWLVKRPLNVEEMRLAGVKLEGDHDSSAFVGASLENRNPMRTISRVEVGVCGQLVHIDIVGNSFLPHQLRHTVGALVGVGLGTITVAEFDRFVGGQAGPWKGQAAPAQGLCLRRVEYGSDEPPWELMNENVQCQSLGD